MNGRNIKSMIPKLTSDGEVIRKITTQTKSENAPTRSRYYHRIKQKDGRTRYVPRMSAPRPTVIRKPLFEVVDDAGNTYQMTKRQAKSVFSARQVRKALKRMPSELTHILSETLDRLRADRHLDDEELAELEQEFDESVDQEFSDTELLGIEDPEAEVDVVFEGDDVDSPVDETETVDTEEAVEDEEE